MKFYKLNEVPIRGDDQVFKASPIRTGVPFIVILVIALTALLLGIRGVNGINVPSFIFFIMAAFAGLFGLLAFHSFRASLKPSNWLLRCHQGGVVVHFRSFLNWRFPSDGIQAVGLDYSEIAGVGIVKERRNSPGFGSGNGGRAQTQMLTFLNLCLVDRDTSALERHLQQENNLSPAGLMISRDYPVRVLPGGVIELRWNGISPSAAKAIRCLSGHVKIAESNLRSVDLTYRKNLSPEEANGKILELAGSGDQIGAVKLARQIYGCSLAEANAYVAKLRSESLKAK